MSELKPTPGPWEAERIDGSNCFDIKCECGAYARRKHLPHWPGYAGRPSIAAPRARNRHAWAWMGSRWVSAANEKEADRSRRECDPGVPAFSGPGVRARVPKWRAGRAPCP